MRAYPIGGNAIARLLYTSVAAVLDKDKETRRTGEGMRGGKLSLTLFALYVIVRRVLCIATSAAFRVKKVVRAKSDLTPQFSGGLVGDHRIIGWPHG